MVNEEEGRNSINKQMSSALAQGDQMMKLFPTLGKLEDNNK